MPIPKHIKDIVWRRYNGNKLDGTCFVCATVITYHAFDAGHVVAKANGGDDTIDNLRPVCRSCNSAMQTENLEDFKAKHFGRFTAPISSAPTIGPNTQAVPDSANCPNCKGKRSLSPRWITDPPYKCPSCRGTGSVSTTKANWIRCRECSGYGRTLLGEERCTKCRGVGIVARKG